MPEFPHVKGWFKTKEAFERFREAYLDGDVQSMRATLTDALPEMTTHLRYLIKGTKERVIMDHGLKGDLGPLKDFFETDVYDFVTAYNAKSGGRRLTFDELPEGLEDVGQYLKVLFFKESEKSEGGAIEQVSRQIEMVDAGEIPNGVKVMEQLIIYGTEEVRAELLKFYDSSIKALVKGLPVTETQRSRGEDPIPVIPVKTNPMLIVSLYERTPKDVIHSVIETARRGGYLAEEKLGGHYVEIIIRPSEKVSE